MQDANWTNDSFMEDNRGKLAVFFHSKQVQNNFKTMTEKRPIFEEKIFLKKLVPGDSTLVVDRPMREQDIDDFPVEWARFEQKKEQKVSGTPIEVWSAISDTQKAEFKALNIFTIDQFAQLADSVGNKIMGFNDLRDKARAARHFGSYAAQGRRGRVRASVAPTTRRFHSSGP